MKIHSTLRFFFNHSIWIAILISVFSMVTGCVPAPARSSSDSTILGEVESPFRRPGSILFAGGPYHSSINIYQVNPDGSELVCLSCVGYYFVEFQDPVWSPDGSAIAYSITSRWGNGIQVRLDEYQFTYIYSDNDQYRNPVWSPDGKQIAFDYSQYIGPAGTSEIFPRYSPHYACIAPYRGVQIEMGDAHCLSLEAWGLLDPDWSPDGQQLVFTCNDYVHGIKQNDICIMVMNTLNSTNLTQTPDVFEYSPKWSPDGNKIAYQRDGDIWVMNADGSGQTNLTEGSLGYNISPAWSPDGSQIVFVTSRTSSEDQCGYGYDCTELYIMNADGSNPHNITNNPRFYASDPDWGPRRPRLNTQAWVIGGVVVAALAVGSVLWVIVRKSRRADLRQS